MKKILKFILVMMVSSGFAQTDNEIIDHGLKELKISEVNVRVLPFNDKIYAKFRNGNSDHIKGYVEGQGKYYTIYIKDVRGNEKLEVLMHELIHVKQMYTLELVKKGNRTIFKGKEYHNADIAYESSPWELEAFNEGARLKNRLRKIQAK